MHNCIAAGCNQSQNFQQFVVGPFAPNQIITQREGRNLSQVIGVKLSCFEVTCGGGVEGVGLAANLPLPVKVPREFPVVNHAGQVNTVDNEEGTINGLRCFLRKRAQGQQQYQPESHGLSVTTAQNSSTVEPDSFVKIDF
ncbi:MAG TPA: hypothetical protein VFK81_16120 [Terriglobales bacterium]|nr:hypothetical protein [Terriglobales bacterium]